MGIKIQDITSKSAKIASTDLIEIAQVSGATYVSRKVTGAEINELSLDTTPQLGGNLDVNGNSIISTANGNINVVPNGTGAVVIGGNSTQATELRFMEDSDNGTNYVALKAANTLAANTIYTLPTADGTDGQVLTTNGSGVLSWQSEFDFKWTLEFMSGVLTGDIYLNKSCAIASVTNIVNSPTTTIQKNGSAYTLGASIVSGDKITVTVSTASVIDLNFTV